MIVEGKLYNSGLTPAFHELYDPVTFPVSLETPMLNNLVKWDHSDTWAVVDFRPTESDHSGTTIVEDSYEDIVENYSCSVEGLGLIYPVPRLLLFVWTQFAKLQGTNIQEVPVVFENILFKRPTHLVQGKVYKFTIRVDESRGGEFEVKENGDSVLSGLIRKQSPVQSEYLDFLPETPQADADEELSQAEVYRELAVRGFELNGLFRGIERAHINGKLIRYLVSAHFIASHSVALLMHFSYVEIISVLCTFALC